MEYSEVQKSLLRRTRGDILSDYNDVCADYNALNDKYIEQIKIIESLTRERDDYLEALEFYGDKKGYSAGEEGYCVVQDDGGHKARLVIDKHREKR